MPLTAEDVASIATVENYIHDEQQAYLMLYGEGLFDTIPIEQDYTVADIKLWIKHHKELAADKYDLVGPWPRWKMGHGSKILPDDTLVSDVMGERFENKWLMQLSLFPKKANEATGAAESTFEEVEEWIPPPPLLGGCAAAADEGRTPAQERRRRRRRRVAGGGAPKGARAPPPRALRRPAAVGRAVPQPVGPPAGHCRPQHRRAAAQSIDRRDRGDRGEPVERDRRAPKVGGLVMFRVQ